MIFLNGRKTRKKKKGILFNTSNVTKSKLPKKVIFMLKRRDYKGKIEF